MHIPNRFFAKALSVVACGALTLSAFGCSSAPAESDEEQVPEIIDTRITTSEIEAQEIEVKDYTYQVDDAGNVTYEIIATNPNTNWIATDVSFSIVGYNAEDKMLVGAGDSAGLMFPGVDVVVVGTTTMPPDRGELATFSVSVDTNMVHWDWTDLSTEEILGMYSLEDVEMGEVEGIPALTGRINSDEAAIKTANEDLAKAANEQIFGIKGEVENQEKVVPVVSPRTVVLFYDADGNIIGGAETENTDLAPEPAPVDDATEGEEGTEGAADTEGEGAEADENVSSPDTFTILLDAVPAYTSYNVVVFPA